MEAATPYYTTVFWKKKAIKYWNTKVSTGEREGRWRGGGGGGGEEGRGEKVKDKEE